MSTLPIRHHDSNGIYRPIRPVHASEAFKPFNSEPSPDAEPRPTFDDRYDPSPFDDAERAGYEVGIAGDDTAIPPAGMPEHPAGRWWFGRNVAWAERQRTAFYASLDGYQPDPETRDVPHSELAESGFLDRSRGEVSLG